MPLPPNPSAFAAPQVAPPASTEPPASGVTVEHADTVTSPAQPGAQMFERATARPSLQDSPAPVKAAVGTAPSLLVNGFNAGLGTPEVTPISIGINVILDWLKNRVWFREQAWTVPLLIVLSFSIAMVVWYLLTEQKNLQTAVTNGFSLMGTAHVNYQSMKAAGVPILAPVKEENKWHPRS